VRVDYLRLARFIAESTLDKSDEDIDLVVSGILELAQRRGARHKLHTPNPPADGESVAVTMTHFKTAALAFDRVWGIPSSFEGPPPGIAVYGATDTEVWLDFLLKFSDPDLIDPEIIRKLGNTRFINTPLESILTRDDSFSLRTLAACLKRDAGIYAIPVFASTSACASEFKHGAYELVAAVLADVSVVDEGALAWEQVAELRNDAEAITSYRRFVRWLNRNFEGKSIPQVEDGVLTAMDDYDSALRKHGISTLLGAIEALVDPKFVTGAGALFAGVAVGGGAAAGASSVVALSLGRIACTMSRQLLEFRELRRNEVAYAVEVRKLATPAIKRAG